VLGLKISQTTIRRIFTSWRWSWKTPQYKQLHKYTAQNIDYYFRFGIWIRTLDASKCKFIDESHFVSKNLSRNRALGPTGEAVVLLREASLTESFTLTLITDFANQEQPVYVSIQENSNTQFGFLRVILEALECSKLKRGDYLFSDSAKIHLADVTFPVIQELLEDQGVTWIFLPTYSPEFNPCELVFAQIKRYFRDYRAHDKFFKWELAMVTARVSHENIKNYYHKCLMDNI